MTKPMIRLSAVASGVVALFALLFASCQATRTSDPGAAATSTAPATALQKATAPVKAEKGGAELWAETCSHCHNLRSPSTYGPMQWEVAVYDMRVRAHLTGEEQRKILEFLKSASE